MQREEKMAKTFKFVYVIILVLYLFFVVKGSDVQVKCQNDADCPQISDFIPIFYKCINNICEVLKPKPFFV
uniref:Nodule-specific cysteine-rich peptide L23 n=1 Tax=Lens culinaris TaxID=3864 RepID=A0A7T8DV76_LENCU|nr:nodule-specific cysteine-rich peptide L23 [Lens culinaris]